MVNATFVAKALDRQQYNNSGLAGCGDDGVDKEEGRRGGRDEEEEGETHFLQFC